jgi:ParB family transcriptional regulator, chromosome partitioning protein
MAGLESVPVALVDASPDQNRERFDRGELVELAASIAELGLIQPIKVRARGGRFVLVAGERRLRAVRDILGHETIAAIVDERKSRNGSAAETRTAHDDDDADAALSTLAENLLRVDPSPLEEAAGYRNVIDHHGFTAAEVARRVGVPADRVRRRLALLELSDEVRHYLATAQLPVGRAELMTALDGNRQHLALSAHNDGVSTDAFSRLCDKLHDEQTAEPMFSPDSFLTNEVHELVAACEHEAQADRDSSVIREVPLGVSEVAELLGVKVAAIHQRRHRGTLPAPDLSVSGVPLWWADTIERWARQTRRSAA